MWPFTKNKQEIKLELTYPQAGTIKIWAVTPAGRWFELNTIQEAVPPAPDPSLYGKYKKGCECSCP